VDELRGRRALVTGGTRGIGAAIARHLSDAGARVVVSARSRGDHDGPGHFAAADVSTADGPPQLTADATAQLGGIDILIDNAATQTRVPGGVLAMTDADWLTDLNGSLLPAVRLDRAVLPAMIAAGGGAIVQIGSNAARLRPASLPWACLVRGVVPGEHVRRDTAPVGDLQALTAGPRPDIRLVTPGRPRAPGRPLG
jgi:NAD(P)-dependent dehydrogenase (short-subunit alcohol dehydrogenase family)